jgi:hypothetical protein
MQFPVGKRSETWGIPEVSGDITQPAPDSGVRDSTEKPKVSLNAFLVADNMHCAWQRLIHGAPAAKSGLDFPGSLPGIL